MFIYKEHELQNKPEVYYESCLPEKYKKYASIAGDIISLRNVLIILTFVEILASIWGFSYYFLKRVRILKIVLALHSCKLLCFITINFRSFLDNIS